MPNCTGSCLHWRHFLVLISEAFSSEMCTITSILGFVVVVMLWTVSILVYVLQIERRKISVVDPTLHNSEISRLLGQRWRKLSDADRQPFIREATLLRAKHVRDHPNYKFRPQRKSKRRTSFRKPLTVRQSTDSSSTTDVPKLHRETADTSGSMNL